MIELKNVYKKYGEETILKNINLTFPDYGIVVIYGPSGCGKTTLLNIISSLSDFEGDVSVNGRHYKKMEEEDRDKLRNTRIGFIFQDYKLFEFETVYANILLSLDLKSEDKQDFKDRRISDLLKLVSLNDKLNEKVCNLSGGEKQRLAIARAIANSPSIILADEPTGNLDDNNSKMIMDLLLRISRNTLVVIVSHDEKLTKEYADKTIFLKDGEVEKVTYKHHNKHIDLLPLFHIKIKEKTARIPLKFCFSHVFNNLKRRKFRTMMSLLVTSISLIGVGLGTMLTNLISTNLYKSYSSIIDANRIILKNNDDNKRSLIKAVDTYEVNELENKYKDYIDYKGIYYWNNFESMFSYYDFSFTKDDKDKALPNFTLRDINEYQVLNGNIDKVYPEQIARINDDEVILGLTYPLINEICYQLVIPRNKESLANYLSANEMIITVSIENNLWGYQVSFSLKVRGFVISTTDRLYHTSYRWNEYIFENKCGLSITQEISSNGKNPWDLKKSYYFSISRGRDSFLEDINFKKEYRHLKCEILDQKYCPKLYKDISTSECDRVAILYIDKEKTLYGYYGEYIKSISQQIDSIFYGNAAGYAVYPDNLMMGFARYSFLALNIEEIDYVIDVSAYLKYEDAFNFSTPDSVTIGHFSKGKNLGFTFNPSYQILKGYKANSYNEIVISKSIANRLNMNNIANASIYLSFPIKEELLPNGYLYRDYVTTKLKVVGISNTDALEINHKEEWSVMFFQTMIGISTFDLDVDSVVVETKEGYEEEIKDKLARAFPKLDVSLPISSVKDSVNKVCGYIEIILLIFSIGSIVIASFILLMCNYLHFVEIKKDIGLIRCLGITKGESSKLIFSHSFFIALISFALSSVQLLIISLVMSKAMASIFMMESVFIINPLSFLFMFLLAFFLAFFSAIVIKNKVDKLDPIECLH